MSLLLYTDSNGVYELQVYQFCKAYFTIKIKLSCNVVSCVHWSDDVCEQSYTRNRATRKRTVGCAFFDGISTRILGELNVDILAKNK